MTVARTGSLTKAARELNLSQPTMSLHLAALTRFLDARLFERRDGRLRLTPAGAKLSPYAEEALAGLRLVLQDIAWLNGRLAGPLAVGTTYVMSRYVLPSVLARFLEQYPRIALQLHVEMVEPLLDELSANALDAMCYIAVPTATPPGLTIEVLGHDRFVVFASPRHPLAGRRQVTARQLSQYPFVAPASTALRDLIESTLRTAGVIPRAAAEGRHHDTIKNLVERNQGYSMLINAAVADELASGRLVALNLDGPPMMADLVAAFQPRPGVSALVRAFIDFVRADLNGAHEPDVLPPSRAATARQQPRRRVRAAGRRQRRR